MKSNKIILVLIMCFFMAGLLGCGSDKKESVDITSDVFAANIKDKVTFTTDLEKQSSRDIKIFFDLEESYDVAMYSTAATCEEIAVFKASSSKEAKKIEGVVKEFVQGQIDTFAVYSADVANRLENAVIINENNYVVLVVCDAPNDANTAVTEILEGNYKADIAIETKAEATDNTTEETEATEEIDIEATEETETTEEIDIEATEDITETIDDDEESTDYILYAENVSGDVKVYDDITVIGNTAYSFYGYSKKNTGKYIDALNNLANKVSGQATVYSMPIPLACDITMPEEYQEYNRASDRNSVIKQLKEDLSSKIKLVDSGDILKEHKDEYIYFRTDHHWTALGAYYTYKEFCNQKGIKAEKLSDYRTKVFDEFTGSYTFSKGEVRDRDLYNNPDSVMVYYPTASEIKMNVTREDGTTFKWNVIHDVSKYSSTAKYATFAGGDYPFITIENKDKTDGSACLVVKDSFGNAFVPFLVDHYQYVYEVDVRYWDGSLASFAKKNKVEDIIFALAMTNVESKYTSGKVTTLCK